MELKQVFSNANIMNKLYTLYKISEQECRRNGRLSPEVGSSREKDLISILVYALGLNNVIYDIPNSSKEDVIICNRKYSIKHISGNLKCSGIKVVWTVNVEHQNAFMMNPQFDYNMLLVFVKDNMIRVIHISETVLKNTYNYFHQNGLMIFNIMKGNSRGIEFDTTFFKTLISNSDFDVSMNCISLEMEQRRDPIMERLKMIETL